MQQIRVLSALVACIFSLESFSALDCNAQVRCSFLPPLAWATDGNYCKVFFNPCHLRNHNCERLARGQPILKDTTPESCFQYCQQACTKELNPVCTTHNDALITFNNPCLWAQEMCNNRQAYIYQSLGTCKAEA